MRGRPSGCKLVVGVGLDFLEFPQAWVVRGSPSGCKLVVGVDWNLLEFPLRLGSAGQPFGLQACSQGGLEFIRISPNGWGVRGGPSCCKLLVGVDWDLNTT